MKKVLFVVIILVCLVMVFVLLTEDEKTKSVRHSVSNTSYDEYNCEDFETWEEAQEVFESAGGIYNDVYGLDRDKDGIPCEVLR